MGERMKKAKRKQNLQCQICSNRRIHTREKIQAIKAILRSFFHIKNLLLKTISFVSDSSMDVLLTSTKLCANGNAFQQKENVERRIIDHRTGGRRRRWKYILTGRQQQ
jgi:phosphoserine phosphatase